MVGSFQQEDGNVLSFFFIENIIDSGLEGLNKTSVLVAHKYIDLG